jgi:hypothetical protein
MDYKKEQEELDMLKSMSIQFNEMVGQLTNNEGIAEIQRSYCKDIIEALDQLEADNENIS